MKHRPQLYRPALIIVVLLSLQAAWGTEMILNSQEVRIARVFERYVAVHYPSYESLSYDLLVEDRPGNWLVTFKLPDGVIGGAPTVILKKGTLEVVQAYRAQ